MVLGPQQAETLCLGGGGEGGKVPFADPPPVCVCVGGVILEATSPVLRC
jgi:hypothetical protein